MVVPSPRLLFACTIPTIIVILSYIWFKRKKELEESKSKKTPKITEVNNDNEIIDISRNTSAEKRQPERVSGVQLNVKSTVSFDSIYESDHKCTNKNNEEVVVKWAENEVPKINCLQEEKCELSLMTDNSKTYVKAVQDFEFINNGIHKSDKVAICNQISNSSEEISDTCISAENSARTSLEFRQTDTADKDSGMKPVRIVDTTINNDDSSFFEFQRETQQYVEGINILDVENSKAEIIKPDDMKNKPTKEIENAIVLEVLERCENCISLDIRNTDVGEGGNTMESTQELEKIAIITVSEDAVGEDVQKTLEDVVDDVEKSLNFSEKEQFVETSSAERCFTEDNKTDIDACKLGGEQYNNVTNKQTLTILDSNIYAAESSVSCPEATSAVLNSCHTFDENENLNETKAAENSAFEYSVLTAAEDHFHQSCRESDSEISVKQIMITNNVEDVVRCSTSERNKNDVVVDTTSSLTDGNQTCVVVTTTTTTATQKEEQFSKGVAVQPNHDNSEEVIGNSFAKDVSDENCDTAKDCIGEPVAAKCPTTGLVDISHIDDYSKELIPHEATVATDRDSTITDIRSMGEVNDDSKVVRNADYATCLESNVGEGGDGSFADRHLEEMHQKLKCSSTAATTTTTKSENELSSSLTDSSDRVCISGGYSACDLQTTKETCVVENLKGEGGEEDTSASLSNSDAAKDLGMCEAASSELSFDTTACLDVEVKNSDGDKESDRCVDNSENVEESQQTTNARSPHVEFVTTTSVDCTDSNMEISTIDACVETVGDKVVVTHIVENAPNCDCACEENSVFSASGLCTDEPELQKLVNGGSLSAYGSASHSPAEDILESPTASNYSDLQSEGSSDSGKGGSDIHPSSAEGMTSSKFLCAPLQVFEFELPQSLCGRLIGQHGRYVNLIKNRSRATVSIKGHPINPDLKLCAVIGSEVSISAALVMIRKRFPLNKFPSVSLLQVNGPLLNSIPLPDTLQLHLPEGVTCDVILSSMVNAGDFFVQQPTHPTYSSLSRLDQFMLACYMNGMGAPELPSPVEPGIICAASTMGGWYRAQVVYVYPDSDECDVKFVDYGGYSREAISSLRQIRSDFMTLPFQASECYLASVAPIDENLGWTLEANSYFEELAQGQILQAQIVAYSEDGIPFVHLYRIQGVTTTFINKQLVTSGLAKWVDHQA